MHGKELMCGINTIIKGVKFQIPRVKFQSDRFFSVLELNSEFQHWNLFEICSLGTWNLRSLHQFVVGGINLEV
jgi:hypothetical protein